MHLRAQHSLGGGSGMEGSLGTHTAYGAVRCGGLVAGVFTSSPKGTPSAEHPWLTCRATELHGQGLFKALLAKSRVARERGRGDRKERGW